MIVVLASTTVSAKKPAPPPSVALKTETSHIITATLQSVDVDGERSMMRFRVLEQLHNEETEPVIIQAPPRLAGSLAVGHDYLLAYERVQKVRVAELKEYRPIKGGPVLISTPGAEPAIYSVGHELISRLTDDTNRIKTDPEGVLDDIMKGIAHSDPKTQSFFVGELLNFKSLLPRLTESDIELLVTTMQSPHVSDETMAMLLEHRPEFHEAMGVRRMAKPVTLLLMGRSTHLDPLSRDASVLLNALNFMRRNKLADASLYERWTSANVATISEVALNALAEQDLSRALERSRELSNQALLSAQTRRVVDRFMAQQRRR